MDPKQKIKTHISENKIAYIGTVVGIAVGAAGVLIFNRTTTGAPLAQKINQIGLRIDVNTVVVNLVERSTPSKPVHLVGTNLYFNSLSEAARETGHPLSTLSKHINGIIPDVKGDVFEILESASQK